MGSLEACEHLASFHLPHLHHVLVTHAPAADFSGLVPGPAPAPRPPVIRPYCRTQDSTPRWPLEPGSDPGPWVPCPKLSVASTWSQVGTSAMDSPLLKYSAKDYFFKAALCHFCIDMLNAKVSPGLEGRLAPLPATSPPRRQCLSPGHAPPSNWPLSRKHCLSLA